MPSSNSSFRARSKGESLAARSRTARAEASLIETEQKIHEIADQARSDLRGTA